MTVLGSFRAMEPAPPALLNSRSPNASRKNDWFIAIVCLVALVLALCLIGLILFARYQQW